MDLTGDGSRRAECLAETGQTFVGVNLDEGDVFASTVV